MENLKKVKETILELIYPSKCPFCGEIVSAGKKHSTEHNGICKACREKLPYIGVSLEECVNIVKSDKNLPITNSVTSK